MSRIPTFRRRFRSLIKALYAEALQMGSSANAARIRNGSKGLGRSRDWRHREEEEETPNTIQKAPNMTDVVWNFLFVFLLLSILLYYRRVQWDGNNSRFSESSDDANIWIISSSFVGFTVVSNGYFIILDRILNKRCSWQKLKRGEKKISRRLTYHFVVIPLCSVPTF